jgi:polysaccharide deacetylase family protein (PEP-CTERM system associated)
MAFCRLVRKRKSHLRNTDDYQGGSYKDSAVNAADGDRVLNAMTIDLEDWAQAVLDPGLPITDHVQRNTERVLQFLDRHHVRATFFALGRVCEKYPQLLPAIASAGHEIASHGYGHQLIHRLNPAEFEADLRKSIDIITSQTGQRPAGYRAPAFSITKKSLWAGPVLAKLGFRYSSSIFPIRKRRYGIADWPVEPAPWPGLELVEFPLTTFSMLGRRWPVCGGGYMRLLPACIHARAISRHNRIGHPAVIYVHPYETAPHEVDEFRRSGMSIAWKRRLMQSLWRSRVEPRLAWILNRYEFGTMSEALAAARLSTSSYRPYNSDAPLVGLGYMPV